MFQVRCLQVLYELLVDSYSGHFQQGTTPSPMDRVRAVRFGVKSMQHLETFAGQSPDEIDDDPLSTAVIGIQGAKVLFSPMEQVEKKKTDWKARRPREEFWRQLKVCIALLRQLAVTKGG